MCLGGGKGTNLENLLRFGVLFLKKLLLTYLYKSLHQNEICMFIDDWKLLEAPLSIPYFTFRSSGLGDVLLWKQAEETLPAYHQARHHRGECLLTVLRRGQIRRRGNVNQHAETHTARNSPWAPFPLFFSWDKEHDEGLHFCLGNHWMNWPLKKRNLAGFILCSQFQKWSFLLFLPKIGDWSPSSSAAGWNIKSHL